MTQQQVELAAKLMKIVQLARSPGMDAVAIKLNCGPTYEELRRAKYWARAFELAQQGGQPFDLARELAANQ